METRNSNLTHSIGQAESALRAVLERLLARTETTFVQWAALNLLVRAGPRAPQLQLARLIAGALKLTESAALATLDELAALGLVARSGGPTSVTLTRAGKELFDHVRRNVDDAAYRLFGDLPAEDVATACRVLETVAERANAELGGATRRA